jgi:hypothetical protein
LPTNGVTSVHPDPSRLPDLTVEVFHPRECHLYAIFKTRWYSVKSPYF